MDDGALAQASDSGRPELSASATSRMAGYCGCCGTWDTHGFACLTCGYDFTPEAATEASGD